MGQGLRIPRATAQTPGKQSPQKASGESPLSAQQRCLPHSSSPSTSSFKPGSEPPPHPRASWDPLWLWGAPCWPWSSASAEKVLRPGRDLPKAPGNAHRPAPQVRCAGPLSSALLTTLGWTTSEARSVSTAQPRNTPSSVAQPLEQGPAGGTGGARETSEYLAPSDTPAPRLLGTEACRTWRVVGRLREGAQSPCSQPARTLRRG